WSISHPGHYKWCQYCTYNRKHSHANHYQYNWHSVQTGAYYCKDGLGKYQRRHQWGVECHHRYCESVHRDIYRRLFQDVGRCQADICRRYTDCLEYIPVDVLRPPNQGHWIACKALLRRCEDTLDKCRQLFQGYDRWGSEKRHEYARRRNPYLEYDYGGNREYRDGDREY